MLFFIRFAMFSFNQHVSRDVLFVRPLTVIQFDTHELPSSGVGETPRKFPLSLRTATTFRLRTAFRLSIYVVLDLQVYIFYSYFFVFFFFFINKFARPPSCYWIYLCNQPGPQMKLHFEIIIFILIFGIHYFLAAYIWIST